MREIDIKEITENVENILLEINTRVSENFLCKLQKAYEDEESILGKEVINQIIENDIYAKQENKPLCQDTGIVVCFLEVGYEVHFNGDIYEAVNEGVKNAYRKGYFRKSVVKDPLERINTLDNTPAITYINFVYGDKVKISIMAKGGGSENMSALKMMIPADGKEGIKKFVIDTVIKAGGKPCPPIIIGIGIGGTFENAAMMAKQALLREIDDTNENKLLAEYETEITKEINKLGIGPMGFGGRVTCLGVKIKTAPCHIASLPVAINIQCHANRHKTVII